MVQGSCGHVVRVCVVVRQCQVTTVAVGMTVMATN